jgi:hypothetical protein
MPCQPLGEWCAGYQNVPAMHWNQNHSIALSIGPSRVSGAAQQAHLWPTCVKTPMHIACEPHPHVSEQSHPAPLGCVVCRPVSAQSHGQMTVK